MILVSLILPSLLYSPRIVSAAINEQINYQGKLLDDTSSPVSDGDYSIVFRLYTVPTAGSNIWTETNTVTVTSGLFSVMLGSTTSLTGVDFNQTLYLGLNVAADGEMTPRKILGAVPAAFQAKEADNSQTLGGVASTSFLRSDQADTIAASTASSLLTIMQSGVGDIFNLFDGGTEVFSVIDGGNIGVGTTTPSSKFSVGGDIHVSGAFKDSSNSAGTNGYVLQTTGAGTSWVATSSLGFGSGDGSVTSVAMSVPTGLAVGGSPITTSGTLALSYAAGYTGVLTASTTDWQTAYGWGDHSAGGYITDITGENFTSLADTISSYNANRILFTSGAAVVDSANFAFNDSTDTITIGGMTIADGLTTHSVRSTTTVPSNDPYAWTISTGVGTSPLFRIDTTTGAEFVNIGNGTGDVLIGDIGSGANLVFEESSTISGQGTNVITLGVAGDVFNSAVNFGIGSTSPQQALSIEGSMSLTGAFYDSSYSAGTNGYILQTTGAGTQWVATSSLGFGTGNGSVTSVAQTVPIGFTVTGSPITGAGTLAIAYDTGYEGLLTASSTNWNNFFNTPSTQITAGTGLSWSSNTLNATGFGDGTFLGLTDTPSSYTANRILFTTGSAVASSSGFTFTGAELSVDGSINIAANNLGYEIEGNRVLYASSTNFSTLAGISAGAALLSDGLYNTAVGYNALLQATSSDGNTAVGYSAGYGTDVSAAGTFIGYKAGYNSEKERVTAIGYESALGNTGTRNTAVGFQSLYNNTANFSTAIGQFAGTSNTGSLVAVGDRAGQNNTGSLVAFGNSAGYGNSGIGITALGAAVAQNNTGNYLTAIGYQTLRYTNAANSVALGYQAGYGNSAQRKDISNSLFLGYRAGYAIATSTNNILIGYQAGNSLTTGSNNLIIGYDVEAPSNTASNQLNIGNLIFGTGIDGVGTTLSSGNIGIGTTTPNYKLSVNGDIQSDVLRSYQFPTGSYLDFDDDQTVGTNMVTIGSIASMNFILDTNNTGSTDAFIFYADDPDVDNATPLMYIDDSGWVGFGTTSPQAMIHLARNTDAGIYLEADTDNSGEADNPYLRMSQDGGLFGFAGYLAFTGSDDTNPSTGEVATGTIANTMVLISESPTTGLQLGTDGEVKMTIDSNGNVGIGDTSPSSLFTVGDGDLFTVDSTGALTAAASIDTDGHVAFGANGSVNANYLVDIDETIIADAGVRGVNVELDRNFTLTANRIDYANYTLLNLNTVVENGFNYDSYGDYAEVRVSPGSTANDIFGQYGYARNNASELIDSATGLYGTARNDLSTGTTTNMYGMQGLADNDGWASTMYGGRFESQYDSTVDTYANLFGVSSVVDVNQSNSAIARVSNAYLDVASGATLGTGYGLIANLGNLGTITTYIGVYIEDVIEGTQTNAYALWANEGDFILDGDGDGIAGGTHAGSDLFFGEGQDAAIWYDGTNLNIDPQVVGSGQLTIAGDLQITGVLKDSTNSAGTNGYVLQTTGSATAWVATSSLGFGTGNGSVTSISGSGGTTGLTLSGGPITTSGTLTLGGTLAVANGGTGLTTFGGANTVLYTTSADTLASDATFTFDGSELSVDDANVNLASSSYAYQIAGSNVLRVPGASTQAIGLGAATQDPIQTVAIGQQALSQTTGGFQTVVGYRAMEYHVSGITNQVFGYGNARYMATGTSNAVFGGGFGSSTLFKASNNAVLGYQAGNSIEDSSNNVLIGLGAADLMTTGANNIMVGYRAADSLTTGSNNLIIGYDVEAPSNTASNQLNIGNLIFGTGIDGVGTTLSSGNVGIGTTTPSEKLNIYNGNLEFNLHSSGQGVWARSNGNNMLWSLTRQDAVNTADLSITAYAGIGLSGGQTVSPKTSAYDFYLASNGNVGIGNVAPTSTLELGADTSGQSNYLTIGKGFDADSGIRWSRDGVEDSAIYSNTNEDLVFSTDRTSVLSATAGDFIFESNTASEIMRIGSDGNVGIGIADPLRQLSLYRNDSAVTDQFRIEQDGTGDAMLSFLLSGLSAWGVGIDNSDADKFKIGTNVSDIGGATKLTILTGGNVGIGVETPASILNIKDANPTLKIETNGTSGTESAEILFQLHDATTEYKTRILSERTGTSFGTQMSFWTRPNSSGDSVAQRMTISEDGNVGIGTTTPSAKLTVSGTGTGTNSLFKIENGGSAILFDLLENGSISFGSSTATTTILGGFDVNNGAINYDWSNNVTSIERLNLGNIEFESDAGWVTWVDLAVSASSSAGTVEAYSAQIDASQLLTLYSQADGSGGIRRTRLVVGEASSTVLASANIPSGSLLVANGALCVDDGEAGNCDDAALTSGQIYAESTSITAVDLAEQYPAKDTSLSAGYLVMLDTANEVFVKKAVRGATTTNAFAGVISTKPGVLLGGFGDTSFTGEKMVPVTLAGRVPVRVNGEHGDIAVGDRLALSSVAGVATKATSSGMTIGVALEAFASTSPESSIVVFIKQEYSYADSEFFIADNGNIGIGTTTPGYKLHVMGDVKASAFINTSASSTKKDIEHLDEDAKDDLMEVIRDIDIATYNYKFETDEDAPLRYGLIAEEAPSEVLSVKGDGVDIYQLASVAMVGIQAVDTSLTELLTLLDTGEINASSSDAMLALAAPTSVWSKLAELASRFVDGVLTLSGIKTDQLCVGEVCVTEAEFGAMVEASTASVGSSSTGGADGGTTTGGGSGGSGDTGSGSSSDGTGTTTPDGGSGSGTGTTTPDGSGDGGNASSTDPSPDNGQGDGGSASSTDPTGGTGTGSTDGTDGGAGSTGGDSGGTMGDQTGGGGTDSGSGTTGGVDTGGTTGGTTDGGSGSTGDTGSSTSSGDPAPDPTP